MQIVVAVHIYYVCIERSLASSYPYPAPNPCPSPPQTPCPSPPPNPAPSLPKGGVGEGGREGEREGGRKGAGLGRLPWPLGPGGLPARTVRQTNT